MAGVRIPDMDPLVTLLDADESEVVSADKTYKQTRTQQLGYMKTNIAPLTTKGDLLGFSTLPVRVPADTNGKILTLDSGEAAGIKWSDSLVNDVYNLNQQVIALDEFAVSYSGIDIATVLTFAEFNTSFALDTNPNGAFSVELPNPTGFLNYFFIFRNGVGSSGNVTLTIASGFLFQDTYASIVLAPGDTIKVMTNSSDGYQIEYMYLADYITQNVLYADRFSLANSTAANVTSISLPPGDWDVTGNVFFIANGSCTNVTCWSSATSASLNNQSDTSVLGIPGIVQSGLVIPPARYNLTTTSTIYLSAIAAFTTNTVQVCGRISARRRR